MSKHRPFSFMFFLSKQSQKETFFDLLDRNECFLDVKSEVQKKSKKSTFWNGVSPWFLSKNWPVFYIFFFNKERQKETFFDILDRKECFFLWFLFQKIDLFLIFFFQQKKPRRSSFFIFWKVNNAFYTWKVKF